MKYTEKHDYEGNSNEVESSNKTMAGQIGTTNGNCDKCCGNCKWKYVEGEGGCSDVANNGYCSYWTEAK